MYSQIIVRIIAQNMYAKYQSLSIPTYNKKLLTFIGDYLITKQTTAEGRICNSVMITERKYTRKEYYLAFMNERAFSVSHKV